MDERSKKDNVPSFAEVRKGVTLGRTPLPDALERLRDLPERHWASAVEEAIASRAREVGLRADAEPIIAQMRPDLLIQRSDGTLAVIELKAGRGATDDVLHQLEHLRQLLTQRMSTRVDAFLVTRVDALVSPRLQIMADDLNIKVLQASVDPQAAADLVIRSIQPAA